MEITYLLNSGFLVNCERLLLVFDDFEDPVDSVGKAVAKGGFDGLYFFVSHSHPDHFSSHILDYKEQATKYVLSDDVRNTGKSLAFPREKTVYMKTYADWEDGNLRVRSFDSTDIGTCFLVETDAAGIFHAGDFNWWHWTGETEENQLLARNAFQKQMKKLEGLEADVAFFPVDGRMGEAWDMGAKEFCARTEVKALVTMHNVGFPEWRPEPGFFPEGRNISCWTPKIPGEKRVLTEGGFEK